MSSKEKGSSGTRSEARGGAGISQPNGTQASMKEKVAAVREVVSNRSNHEITLVLQYYDLNVHDTIAAFLEDGGATALHSWNYTKNKPVQKKKKKKEHNGGDVEEKQAQTQNSSHNDGQKSVIERGPGNRQRAPADVSPKQALSSLAEVPDSSKKEVGDLGIELHPAAKSALNKKGLEKCAKDLNRHALTFKRTRTLLEEEMVKSRKRLRDSFKELHNALDAREKQLLEEITATQQQASDLLDMREEQAAQLKIAMARSDRMTAVELDQLRINSKHFVSERKLDEDIGRAVRFIRDHHRLVQEIQEYGEVTPAKNEYTMRRLSISSTTSSLTPSENTSNTLPSPTYGEFNMSTDLEPRKDNKAATTALSISELADLNKKLQESCRLQGLPVTSSYRTSDGTKIGKNEKTGATGDARAGNRYDRNRKMKSQRVSETGKGENQPSIPSRPSGDGKLIK